MRRHKYGAKKTMVDGIVFDSKAEANYYYELKILKRAGLIVDFELQPEFILLESFVRDGKKIRGIKYRADFRVTHLDGSTEIVDVKGYETPEFKLKQKLFYSKYPDLKLTLVS